MATLSVCCLAKNEEVLLPEMIRSIKGVASEIVVLDTGSTDRTVELARDLGVRCEHGQLGEDFSRARNQLLDLARGEWVLMLDADECVHEQHHDAIEQAIVSPRHTAYTCTVFNVLPQSVVSLRIPVPSVRLFRRNEKLRFQGNVHEGIDASLRKLTLAPSPSSIQIEHMGYTSSDSLRRLRNRRLFESELSKDPTEAWVRLHMGLSLYIEQDYTKAEEYLNYVLSSQSQEISQNARSMIVSLLADAHCKQGKKMSARSQALRAVQMGGNVFAEYVLATIDMNDNAFENALRRLLDIDTHSMSDDHFKVHRGNLYADIAKCYLHLNKHDRALQYVELAREVEPSFHAMMIGGLLCERQRDPRRALQFYSVAKSLMPTSREVLDRIRVCESLLSR